MKKYRYIITILTMMFLVSACSKKTHPAESTGNTSNNPGTATHTVKKTRTAVPKVIVVNDSAASKTFDGRYYYDLQGHRYWRNNNDGKYYLYNKSMNSDPAFKKQ